MDEKSRRTGRYGVFNSEETMNKLPPLDFDQMERDLQNDLKAVTVRRTEKRTPDHDATAVQIIAHGITCLTWKDSEAMGNAIQAKMKDGASLTAAIQAWAEEWETFK